MENTLIETLKKNKFSILSFENKLRGNVQVIHIKLSALLENFENEIDVYNSLKASISKIVPKIRDFDEGMRNLNVRKLYDVMGILGNKVSERIVKRLFYQYDDILRLNLSANEIARRLNFPIPYLQDFYQLKNQFMKFYLLKNFILSE